MEECWLWNEWTRMGDWVTEYVWAECEWWVRKEEKEEIETSQRQKRERRGKGHPLGNLLGDVFSKKRSGWDFWLFASECQRSIALGFCFPLALTTHHFA